MPRTRRSRKNTAKGCVDRNVPLKSYVCGTCHQGDDIFSSPGSQCVCMAIVGASFLSDAIVASSEGVDNILFAGNDLYLTVIYKLQVSGQLKSNSLLPDEVFDTVSNFFINSDCYLLSRKVLNFPLVGTVHYPLALQLVNTRLNMSSICLFGLFPTSSTLRTEYFIFDI